MKLLLPLLAIILVAIGWFLYARSTHPATISTPQVQKTTETILPEQFKAMTIPFLRSRSYTSKLGPLKEYASNDSYTSYLTSYTSDGLKINALLTIPNEGKPFDSAQGESYSGKKFPAIVFVHGYIPPDQYITTERYAAYVDYLARNGFVVFKIDLRGHGNSEGKAGGGYFGSDYVVDTLNAYAAMQSTNFVNPKAVGMWGHSMSGNILLRSAVVKETIPAIVIWAGAVYSYEDQRKYGIQDNSYHPPQISSAQRRLREQLFSLVGSPSASSPFWSQVAPTNYLNDLKGAIEIHHAVDDNVVNVGYSRDLVALLDKTKVPHEYYEYETGGHNISDPSFSLAMERTVTFFNKYLKK